MIGLAAGTRIWIVAGATRIYGVERDGADGAPGKSVFRSSFYFSWAAWKTMVGPWGLEPQTSSVSKPGDYERPTTSRALKGV